MGDRRYVSTLKTIYVLESLGECIYLSMARKSGGDLHRRSCLRLAENERQTKLRCAEELKTLAMSLPEAWAKVSASLASVFFRLSSLSVQQRIMYRILDRSICKRWDSLYREKNSAFWDGMLAHEQLQHELMGMLKDRPA